MSEGSFANEVLRDWDDFTQRFFEAVDKKRIARGLTDEQVHAELDRGYGPDVAVAWVDWVTQ